MPKPTDEEKKLLLACFVREKGLNFILDPSPQDLAGPHSPVLSDVRQLKAVEFETYHKNAQCEPEKTPWKLQKLCEAENLVQLTCRSIHARLNEDGWRSELEHHIFGSFIYGISCKTCGGRLWRAFEDPHEVTFGPLMHHLNLRLEHRQECQCLQNGHALQQERAVNELFSSRSGEYLIKDHATDELLPKQGPDRVYGLRRTAEFDEVLSRKYISASQDDPNSGKVLSDVLQASPFTVTPEPLLFPFLVAEWKSEKSGDGFYDTQNQTALPIRRLLQLQLGLQSAARTRASIILNPLVWFFAIRGDDVRVYAAYNTDEGLTTKINVSCLLDCRISKRDGALQLLLLIDYLFEWARDIYCPLVKHQLKLLAAPDPDTYSFHGGTDATTLRQYRNKRPLDADLAIHSDVGDGTGIIDLFPDGLDTQWGVVRSAYNIESKFRGLVLDSFNVDDFLKSLAKRHPARKTYVRKLADKIVRAFRVSKDKVDDRCLVSERKLNLLEKSWTGTAREISCMLEEGAELWAKIQHTTYLSHDWEQVRELSYLAMSKQALNRIQKFSEVKESYFHPPSELELGLLERLLTKIKEGSVEHNLAAAICRSTLSIPQTILANAIAGYGDSAGLIWDQDVQLRRTPNWITHEVILSVFETRKDHEGDLQACPLRESQKSETQKQNISGSSWPLQIPRLVQCNKGIVIVFGPYSAKTRAQRELRGSMKPDLCVFVLERVPRFAERLGDVLRDAILTWTIYATRRRDWPSFITHGDLVDRNRGLRFVDIESKVFLGQTAGDDVPWPRVGRIKEFAETHRKARNLNVEELRRYGGASFYAGQPHASSEDQVPVMTQEPASERHISASSAASGVGTIHANDLDPERRNLLNSTASEATVGRGNNTDIEIIDFTEESE